MKTLVVDSKTDLNSNGAGKSDNSVTKENQHPQFVAGNPVNKDSAKPAEMDKPIEAAPIAEPAKSVPPKEEMKTEPAKTVLNLEGTLKLVEELHRRKIQRDKLLETIANLDAFEFDLGEELDETDGNYYTGCALTIEDDARRKFVTKNPTIIWTVAQMVNRLCVDKLAEIEAGLTLPA